MSSPNPNFAALGLQLHTQRRFAEAADAYRKHLEAEPLNADVHYNLGLALQEAGQFLPAIASYNRALELRPTFASAAFNRGNVLASLGRQAEAIDSYRLASYCDPKHARTRLHLAHVLGEQGHIDEATEICRSLVAQNIEARDSYALLLFLEQFRFGQTIESLQRLHEQWDLRFARPLATTWQPHTNDRNPERRLRLGILSGDLRHHAVAYCVTPVLEQLDRNQFEVYAYSNRARDDDWQSRIRQLVAVWLATDAWSDEQLARQIRDDAVDIVLDLAGHTSGNRLLTLARRPAPIQISWLGYPFPSCLQAIDYHLCDRWLVPDELVGRYRTQLMRLPTMSTSYEVAGPTPDVASLPARTRGHVTFASFNKANKLNSALVATWAEILAAVPDARLLLKFRGLGDSVTAAQFRARFALYGIDPTRIDFEGHSPFQEMFQRYTTVDIGLDPFPYTGGTTTMLASWMGVPVVTWPGETLASRQSYTVLKGLGLEDTIAADRDEYVRIAVELARDWDRLEALRLKFRPAYQQSALANGGIVAKELAIALRAAWTEWCRLA